MQPLVHLPPFDFWEIARSLPVQTGRGGPPVTAAEPVTVRLPLSESENAEMPLVDVTVANVGALGSFGMITLGICLVVIAGPLISIS